MNVTVEVDVALRRPPAVHATVFVDVAVDLPALPSSRDFDVAEAQACETACAIAHTTRRDVVMPVGARIVDVVV